MFSTFLGSSALGPNQTLSTKNGSVLKKHIYDQQKFLNLTQPRGCLKETYAQGEQLYSLYTDQIVPSTLFSPPYNLSQWFLQNSGGLRYGLYSGNVSMDDVYKVLPFRDIVYHVQNVEGNILVKLFAILNSDTFTLQRKSEMGRLKSNWDIRISKGGARAAGSDQWLATNLHPAQNKRYDIFYVGFDAPVIEAVLVRYPRQCLYFFVISLFFLVSM